MIKLYQKLFVPHKTGNQTMKPNPQIFKFLCCLCLLALAGCGGDPDRNRIVGDWEIATADRLIGQVNAEPLSTAGASDSASSTSDSVEDQKPRMLIRFYYSGSLATETNMGNVSTQKVRQLEVPVLRCSNQHGEDSVQVGGRHNGLRSDRGRRKHVAFSTAQHGWIEKENEVRSAGIRSAYSL